MSKKCKCLKNKARIESDQTQKKSNFNFTKNDVIFPY